MTRDIETYFLEGCGRCALGGTPECKVHRWAGALQFLRAIVLSCGLEETVKWGQPCYMHKGKNILLVTTLKDFVILSFFKGCLLSDANGWFAGQGGKGQEGRVLRFTDEVGIHSREAVLREYIFEAIAVEESGIPLPPRDPESLALPEELRERFLSDAAFEAAFRALTPGRQRGYLFFFNGASKSATRISRIEKSMPDIFRGKGLQD